MAGLGQLDGFGGAVSDDVDAEEEGGWTMLTGGIYKGSKSGKFALEAALNRSGVEEHIPGIYLGYS